jgi:aldehyde dehydrogenase (NAD+)
MDRAVQAARVAFDEGPWAQWSPDRRATAIDALADGLEARSEELRSLVTIEVGMPTAFSAYAQQNTLVPLRYYAQQARQFEFRTDRKRSDGGITRIRREPVGVVGAIARGTDRSG